MLLAFILFPMLVELTPRSAELIARQQGGHGAVSPEQMIELALEAYSGESSAPAWYRAGAEERQDIVLAGLEDVRQGRVILAEDVLREMDTIARGR